MKKIILLMVLLSSLIFANNIKIGNFSVGLNSQDKTCYVMNDVDAFYVYKLYLNGDVKVYYLNQIDTGIVIKATEVYKNIGMDFIFFNNIETCKKYKTL